MLHSVSERGLSAQNDSTLFRVSREYELSYDSLTTTLGHRMVQDVRNLNLQCHYMCDQAAACYNLPLSRLSVHVLQRSLDHNAFSMDIVFVAVRVRL